MKEKKEVESNEFIKNLCPFKPNIANQDVPRLDSFYLRLQDWMEIKYEKSKK